MTYNRIAMPSASEEALPPKSHIPRTLLGQLVRVATVPLPIPRPLVVVGTWTLRIYEKSALPAAAIIGVAMMVGGALFAYVNIRWSLYLFHQVVRIFWLDSALCFVIGATATIGATRTLRRNRLLKRRQAMGLCLHCGYSLAGNVSGVCPECGAEIKSPRETPAHS